MVYLCQPYVNSRRLCRGGLGGLDVGSRDTGTAPNQELTHGPGFHEFSRVIVGVRRLPPVASKKAAIVV